jgi:hypothetical protein
VLGSVLVHPLVLLLAYAGGELFGYKGKPGYTKPGGEGCVEAVLWLYILTFGIPFLFIALAGGVIGLAIGRRRRGLLILLTPASALSGAVVGGVIGFEIARSIFGKTGGGTGPVGPKVGMVIGLLLGTSGPVALLVRLQAGAESKVRRTVINCILAASVLFLLTPFIGAIIAFFIVGQDSVPAAILLAWIGLILGAPGLAVFVLARNSKTTEGSDKP